MNSSLPLLSENIYSEIRQSLSMPLNISSSMARDTFLINWVIDGEKDTDAIVKYLQNIKEKYSFFTSFYVSEKTKNYYYYQGTLKKISQEDPHDIWYYDFIDSNREFDLDVDTNEAEDGILTIFINFRLEDHDSNLLGVVGVGIRLDRIADELQEKRKTYNRNIYLIDENGIIQVHSNLSMVEQINIYNAEGIKTAATALMTTSEKPVEATYNSGSGRMLVSSRYIPDLNWHVIVEQDEKSSLAGARRSLIISLIVTLGIAAVIYLLSNRILSGFKQQMEILAGTDNLTNTANRRELYSQFEKFKYRSLRYQTSLSLIIIDLDEFKEINDNYGHLEGDRVLKDFSSLLNDSIRPTDLLARWGGDEFIIIMEATEKESLVLASRILSFAKNITCGKPSAQKPLTVSMGIAEYSKEQELDELIARADSALYKSKINGKDRATTAD